MRLTKRLMSGFPFSARIGTVALALATVSWLAGCGSKSNSTDSDESSTKTSAETTDSTSSSTDAGDEPLTMIEIEGLYEEASTDVQAYRLSDGETKMRRVLAELAARSRDPRAARLYLAATRNLADLLIREGRRWEAQPFLQDLLESGAIQAGELLFLGNRSYVLEDSQFRDSALHYFPENPMPNIAVARAWQLVNDTDKAMASIDKVLDKYPDQIEANALFGVLLAERNDVEGMKRWAGSLSDEIRTHADVWLAQGLMAQQLGDTDGALRAFWESVRRDPNQQQATYQIGLILREADRNEEANAYLERADLLNQFNTIVEPMWEKGLSAERVSKAADLATRLGRFQEAIAWYSILRQLDSESEIASQRLAELMEQVDPAAADLVSEEFQPALQYALADVPLPDWSLNRTTQSQLPADGPPVRFVDLAGELGLNFKYFESADESTPGRRVFETTGGGVGVLDFDRDGWPDTYWTQGAPWPVDPNQTDYIDRLLRNVSGSELVDVTEITGLEDAFYSQGVACGDVNNDGFPDIYVGNIGENRLYMNNGDGTFDPVEMREFGDQQVWTTSCLMADLNGDGLPDLYDANYLAGDDVHTRICGTDFPQACPPTDFDAARDQVYLNLGNGEWREISQSSGVQPLEGKGLGLIAADFDGSGAIQVFVANDAGPNFFLVNNRADGESPVFDDFAMANGLANDRLGKVQACMGVAFGDADGNGLFDLFITNYYEDSNTLYTQQPGLLFDDSTRQAGLRDGSFWMLGWGAQFVDVELDGLPDLVFTNGHLEDFTRRGEPFEMRPQMFRNRGDMIFVERTDVSSDDYFAGEHRGRGMARLDFNRDGREDVAISKMDETAALVINQTEETGNYLVVRLVGTSRSRDAVGARVQIETNQGTRAMSLAAGSGYQASNEPILVFGLGLAEEVSKLSVTWPGGQAQSFGPIPANCRIVLIEGHPWQREAE